MPFGGVNVKYRAMWASALAGMLVQAALVASGGLSGLSIPAGIVFVAAMALTFATVLGMALAGLSPHRRHALSRPTFLFRTAALSVVALLTLGAVVLASTAGDTSTQPIEESPPILPQAAAAGTGSLPAGAEAHVHTAADAAANPMGIDTAHEHAAEVPVTAAQLAAAAQFVADVKADTAKYADIRAGMAAGYIQLTQDLPGIAAHFINLAYMADGVEMDPAKPEFLLYTRRLDGNWRLVGTMFYGKDTPDPPSYFGPLDAWHRHENLCFTAASVRVAASQADCPGGLFTKQTAWQLHVWTEPGGTGVFAHDYAPINPGPFPPADRPAAKDLAATP